MCKIQIILCSINTLKNSINKITEFIVIFKKIENATVCVSFLSGIYGSSVYTLAMSAYVCRSEKKVKVHPTVDVLRINRRREWLYRTLSVTSTGLD